MSHVILKPALRSLPLSHQWLAPAQLSRDGPIPASVSKISALFSVSAVSVSASKKSSFTEPP